MAEAKKEKRKKETQKIEKKQKKSMTSGFGIIYAIVVITMLTVFAVGMTTTFSDTRELTSKKSELEEEIENEEKKNSELSMEGDYYKSDEYYEKIAREKLGLVMPN